MAGLTLRMAQAALAGGDVWNSDVYNLLPKVGW